MVGQTVHKKFCLGQVNLIRGSGTPSNSVFDRQLGCFLWKVLADILIQSWVVHPFKTGKNYFRNPGGGVNMLPTRRSAGMVGKKAPYRKMTWMCGLGFMVSTLFRQSQHFHPREWFDAAIPLPSQAYVDICLVPKVTLKGQTERGFRVMSHPLRLMRLWCKSQLSKKSQNHSPLITPKTHS